MGIWGAYCSFFENTGSIGKNRPPSARDSFHFVEPVLRAMGSAPEIWDFPLVRDRVRVFLPSALGVGEWGFLSFCADLGFFGDFRGAFDAVDGAVSVASTAASSPEFRRRRARSSPLPALSFAAASRRSMSSFFVRLCFTGVGGMADCDFVLELNAGLELGWGGGVEGKEVPEPRRRSPRG